MRNFIPAKLAATFSAVANGANVAIVAVGAVALCGAAFAMPASIVELHDHLHVAGSGAEPGQAVALTLDACGGAFDADLIGTLVAQRIPATVFVTKKWLDRNPRGVAALLAHPELFELEDHGAAHLPAVLGVHRRVYGIAGVRDLSQLEAEVSGGARAIVSITGRVPRYYRGATALYDAQSLQAIRGMGYQVAGFSVNADAGATLPQASIMARLRAVQPGDVVIAHMNKPAGATAEALAAVLPELKARGYRFVTLTQGRLTPAP